jgi:hypothetical protein
MGVDPFFSGVAGTVLRQQGQSYLQRGQVFLRSRMDFLSSGGLLQYLFNVTPEYGETEVVAAAYIHSCCPPLGIWVAVNPALNYCAEHGYQLSFLINLLFLAPRCCSWTKAVDAAGPVPAPLDI